MLGILYLFMCLITGWLFTRTFFPNLKDRTVVEKKNGKIIELPYYFVLLPSWYISGTLIVTWCVYIVSMIYEKNIKPMVYGNVLTLGVLVAVLFVVYVYGISKKRIVIRLEDVIRFFWTGKHSYNIFSLIVLFFCTVIMYRTFFWADGSINVGYSVWADFGAHLSMIRSFSYGSNFPTQYAYFGGTDIKYHFMHEFLVGNLEFLGLRLDHAFNIPSILSLFSVYLLLFTLACNLFKNTLTAWLGCLFFTFRSSPSAFKFLAEQEKGSAFKALLENSSYFSYSDYHESWGFWCTRVFCNQRHLAFGIAALIIAVLLFLPHYMKLGKVLLRYREEGIVREDSEGTRLCRPGVWDYAKTIFFSRDSFAICDIKLATGAGLFLGMLAFWHGSMLIASLSILFFMAAFSSYRLDYLITAVIATAGALIQSDVFIEGSAVHPEYYFGFVVDNRSFFNVVSYIAALTGITLLIALFGAIKTRGTVRYLLFCFFVPFILAFTLKITPDIGVNHKWIILSLMFVSLYTGHFVAELFTDRDAFKFALAILLTIVLTFTGMTELYIQYKEDNGRMSFRDDDPVTVWIRDNITADDLVLGDEYALTNIVMGGIINYYSYPYCTWSAGYDTKYREKVIKEIFEASTPSHLAKLCYREKIDYIIVDITNRESSSYILNESNIENTFEEVFSNGDGKWSVRIFDTNRRIY